MRTLVVKVKAPAYKQKVIDIIRDKDISAELDPEGNPVLFWIDTSLPIIDILNLGGVEDVIESINMCPCGSGEKKYALNDARGIFCCYVCSKCEEEKRSHYRTDIFEDACYEANEPIEPEDY